MLRKLIVGNWKMNGSFLANEGLLSAVAAQWRPRADRSLVVCPPYPYLYQAKSALQGTAIKWGAQNVSEHEKGAYTGEVSAAMLIDFACDFVIVGHSERRQLYGDSDQTIAAKAHVALANQLTPIVCVGETEAERELGITDQIVSRQLNAVMERLGSGTAGIVVAYEPVWAIGTGKTAKPGQVADVHRFIRSCLRKDLGNGAADQVALLYGGSVKPDSATALFATDDVDGGLIGGASLSPTDFIAIANA